MSPPPPNQALVVTMKRVFMCTAGTRGLRRCATKLIPVAMKRGSASAPGICLRNSGENSPKTVETLTPTFSNTLPFMTDITPPPPSGRSQAVRTKRPAGRAACGPEVSSSSQASKAAQIRSRSDSNQARAGGAMGWSMGPAVSAMRVGFPCRGGPPRPGSVAPHDAEIGRTLPNARPPPDQGVKRPPCGGNCADFRNEAGFTPCRPLPYMRRSAAGGRTGSCVHAFVGHARGHPAIRAGT